MSLPLQIQREAEQLAQLEQALYAPQPSPEPAPAEVAPAPPEAVVEVPAPAPAEPPAPPAVDWEQKYRTLQGVFNSQVPTLQQQVKEMQAEMARMKEAKAPEQPPKPDADPKDSEVFGADVVDMVVRTTKGLMMPLVTDLQSRLTKLEQLASQLTQTSGATAEEVFFDRLEAKVADWEAINQDQRFIAWLDQVDPVYQQPRRVALQYARERLDANAVASIFTVFKQNLQPVTPPPATPKPSLEQQVVPGTGAASPAPHVPPAKPTITQREIQQFYNELAQGKWRGREQAAMAREAEINLAVREDRVR